MSDNEWHDAGLADLADGVCDARDVDGRMVMVVRQADRWFATDATCPHKFTLLTEGAFGDACVTCPQHDATFDLTTGDAGNDSSWAGRLPVHEIRLSGERVEIRLAD